MSSFLSFFAYADDDAGITCCLHTVLLYSYRKLCALSARTRTSDISGHKKKKKKEEMFELLNDMEYNIIHITHHPHMDDVVLRASENIVT